MNFNKKGQGSLEYLLIIGVAILVAAIVIYVVVQAIGSGQDTANSGLNDVQMKSLVGQATLAKAKGYDYLHATVGSTQYYANVDTPSIITTAPPTGYIETKAYVVTLPGAY